VVSTRGNACVKLHGIKELTCGGQAFIATSLFDPSMSALPIIETQNLSKCRIVHPLIGNVSWV
jgi:hypothetical protein